MDAPYLPEGYSLTESLESRSTKFARPEKVLKQNTDYRAVIETTKGRMVVDLYQDLAPETVNNFVFLALNHYYDGVVFHRVLEDFMAQTGDPSGSGSGGPGYTFADEVNTGLKHDAKGVLSMANTGRPVTNGSQFFITFRPTPHLDGRHTVFGRVLEGLDVLDKLTRIDPQRPSDIEPDSMQRVYIVEAAS